MAENNFSGTVEALFKGMDGFLTTKTVVGDAVKFDDGTIILPLVDVSFGVGAGAFAGDKKNNAGGGMGGKISPSCVLVIKDGHAKLVNVKNQDVVTKVIDMVPDVLDRFTKGKKEKADLDKVAVGGFLSGVAKRIDSVYCGKDKKFSNFGNGLGYNKFANTLYLKFQNERTISIVDINDKENCEVLHTYQGDFDVYSLTGDKDNTVTHVLRQVSKVSLDGATSVRLYACTYQPSRFEQKALITTLFIVAIVLAVLLLLVSLWLFLAFKNERQMRKVKVISRDLKKHKYVYLALVGFVVLLVMFCYYEAIGALSMSFFDYTREKPASL